MKVKTHFKTKKTRLTGKARRELAEKVWERDNYSCQNPNCDGESFIDRFPHHTQFLSQGGSDILENLVTLCQICHSEVHDRRLFIDIDGEGGFKFFKPDK